MNEEGSKSGILLRIVKILFSLLIFPFRLIITNPKIFLVILISSFITFILIKKNPKLLGIQTQLEGSSPESITELVNEVGRIIALPEGESPTVATVTDKEAVKNQPFFAKAENGDKVLIFSAAKKAYLYRPSEKKIIEVGVVSLGKEKESTNLENSESLQKVDESSPSANQK